MFGREDRSNGAAAGARRQAPPAQGGDAGGPARGGGDREAAAWTKSMDLYDPWHSALEVGVKVTAFGSQMTLSMAPVEKGKEGDDYQIERGVQRYKRDDSLFAVLKPEEVVVLSRLLDSFLEGRIRTATLSLGREEGKRIVLDFAESYYQPGHPWLGALANSMVMSIERDANSAVDERFVTFFCRPKEYVLDDAPGENGEPQVSWLYPEMMAISEFCRGFLAGLPRQDFASVRLLGGAAGGSRSSSESGTQPRRLSAAAPAGPAAGRPGPGGRPAPQPAAGPPPGRHEGHVTDADIAAGLGGGSLDAALGDDTPGF